MTFARRIVASSSCIVRFRLRMHVFYGEHVRPRQNAERYRQWPELKRFRSAGVSPAGPARVPPPRLSENVGRFAGWRRDPSASLRVGCPGASHPIGEMPALRKPQPPARQDSKHPDRWILVIEGFAAAVTFRYHSEMAQHPQRHHSLDEYFSIEEMSEVRHEYSCGEILALLGGSRNHNQIAQNLTRAFDRFGARAAGRI